MGLTALYAQAFGKLGGISPGLWLLRIVQGPKVRGVDREQVWVPHSPACALQDCDDPCVVHRTVLDVRRGSEHNFQSYSNAYYFVSALGLPGKCFYEN